MKKILLISDTHGYLDDKIIKYKDKEGESQEMTAGAAKKQPDDHPAKQAWNKMAGDGTIFPHSVAGDGLDVIQFNEGEICVFCYVHRDLLVSVTGC